MPLLLANTRSPLRRSLRCTAVFGRLKESFKVTKSDFESRPVYLSLKEHIDAHFLTCFISLVIIRILEYRLRWKYSVTEILRALVGHPVVILRRIIIFLAFTMMFLKISVMSWILIFSKKYMKLGDIKKF